MEGPVVSISTTVSVDPYKHDGFQHIHSEMQETVGVLCPLSGLHERQLCIPSAIFPADL
jgi:hypothetical protein